MSPEPGPLSEYAVLIAEEPHFKPSEIARALAALRHVPFQDLVGPMRRCWGLVEEGCSKAEAEAAAAALASAGLASLAVPAALLEDLPAARPVSEMSLDAGGFLYGEAPAARGRAVWPRVRLLAAAVYAEAKAPAPATAAFTDPGKKLARTAFSLMTGIPTSLGLGGKQAERKQEATEQVSLLDIVLEGPPERLRVDARRFDFSCLKTRMVYDVLGNFRQLIRELAGQSAVASRNRGVRVLLEGKPIREMGYDGAKDLERESRWLLTLQALRPGR
ncbi:MAG: hypothetical protein AAB576_05520 [Elusimicrobiota bacterium]